MDRRWLWLLTAMPALVVFALVSSSSPGAGVLGPLLMILEIGFVSQVAQSMIRIKRETGDTVPFTERLGLIPIAFGLVFYALYASGEIAGHSGGSIGCAVVGVMAVAKTAILRSRIRPIGTPSL